MMEFGEFLLCEQSGLVFSFPKSQLSIPYLLFLLPESVDQTVRMRAVLALLAASWAHDLEEVWRMLYNHEHRRVTPNVFSAALFFVFTCFPLGGPNPAWPPSCCNVAKCQETIVGGKTLLPSQTFHAWHFLG